MQKVFPAAVLAICSAGKISQRMQHNFGKLFFLLCLNVCIRSKRVLIITGGYSDDPHVSRSAEVWSPDGQQCQLPSLRDDDRFLHTQDGLLCCGGGHQQSGWSTCVTLESSNGWLVSHNISLEHGQRWGHTSWSTDNGVYLFGGGIWADYGVLVKSNGQVEHGFDLKNDTNIQADNSVVITGGYHHGTLATVSRYNVDGWVESLPMMITPRYSHACAHYVDSGNRQVYLVTGGFTGHGSGRLASTEQLVDGHHHWTLTAPLPLAMSGLRAATLDNRVVVTGGYDDPEDNRYLDTIYQFDGKSWTQVGKMLERRAYHAVSVVNFEDVSHWCKKKSSQ